jgi:hypothetical protein
MSQGRAQFHEQHLLDAQARAAQLFARKSELQGAWFASMVRRELQRLNHPP